MTIEQNSGNSIQDESKYSVLGHQRSIFRTEARQHYLANQEKVEFPRLLSSKLFVILWILALSLLLLGSFITFWPLIRLVTWG